ncbi:hypothetical protein [Bacillus chungangensis]|uniref:Uncharacterized protein n=1 Tax=Bacillus chungangensis TaxID=587633 RepID=A0ABT9WS01_9BACI|nr:hypothetical protein [Bacillus chungangensis]MDQ0175951.1 hypothetical protein [Bacillus chungangensis]
MKRIVEKYDFKAFGQAIKAARKANYQGQALLRTLDKSHSDR